MHLRCGCVDLEGIKGCMLYAVAERAIRARFKGCTVGDKRLRRGMYDIAGQVDEYKQHVILQVSCNMNPAVSYARGNAI